MLRAVLRRLAAGTALSTNLMVSASVPLTVFSGEETHLPVHCGVSEIALY
jgi:hypothetical protein